MEMNPSKRGSPGVFGTGINPLIVYLQQNAGRQAFQAQAHQEERKKRDEFIGDLRKFNPDKVWEPFYDEVNRYVQTNVRDHAFSQLEKGVSVSRLSADLEKRKGEANTLVNKINWLKSQHEDLGKRIDSDKYLNPTYYHSKLNDHFFNGMQAKPVNEIKTDNADKIFDDSAGYNLHEITKDFMTSLPAKINEHYTQYWDQLGKNYNIQDTSTKLGLEYDDKGNVVIDPRTSQPKIKMTDDVYTQALGNKYLMNIVKDNLPPDANHQQKREFLTGVLEGLDPKQIKNRPQQGGRLDQDERNTKDYTAFGINFGMRASDIEARRDWLDKITTQKRPDLLAAIGNLSKDIKAEYSKDGKEINLTYPTGLESEDPNYTPNKGSLFTSGKRSNTVSIKIGTAEEKKAARFKLSEIIDSQLRDPKSAVGSDRYVRYEEAWAADQAKKAKGSVKTSGVKWK